MARFYKDPRVIAQDLLQTVIIDGDALGSFKKEATFISKSVQKMNPDTLEPITTQGTEYTIQVILTTKSIDFDGSRASDMAVSSGDVSKTYCLFFKQQLPGTEKFDSVDTIVIDNVRYKPVQVSNAVDILVKAELVVE